MDAITRWKPGDTVVLRGVWRQKIWYAGPVFLVQDDPDMIAFYWRAGTREKNYYKRVSAQDLLIAEKVDLADHVWSETDVLMLVVPDEAHSVWAMWETGQKKLRCWYVNLEMPLQRTRIGFDSMDYELDIIISPDRSSWRWKDEDEFEAMITAGVFSVEEARAIRAEGERVVLRMLANEPPFCDGWEKWAPPPDWTIPELPEGWDKL